MLVIAVSSSCRDSGGFGSPSRTWTWSETGHHFRESTSRNSRLFIPSFRWSRASQPAAEGISTQPYDIRVLAMGFAGVDCPHTRTLTWVHEPDVSHSTGGLSDRGNIHGHAKDLLCSTLGRSSLHYVKVHRKCMYGESNMVFGTHLVISQ